MSKVDISIACGDYDRVRPIKEHRVPVDGCTGIDDCRHEIETLIGYSFAQGLLARKLTVEDIFHPATFTVSRT